MGESLPGIIGGRYRLGAHISSGAFSEVRYGLDIYTQEVVAVKLEHQQAELPQLRYEAKIYKVLAGGVGLPRMRWHGTEGNYSVIVADLLGPCLQDLFKVSTGESRLELIISVGQKIVDRLEYLHDKKFIHRDLKLENFLSNLDANQPFEVNMVDFGLAKKYCCSKTGVHIPYRCDKTTFTGNHLFASINSHLGVESSRRDDLESLAYIMIYLYRGDLPWQYDGKHAYKKKISTLVEVLCANCPPEFGTFLQYCRRIEFAERPDYNFLRRLLSCVFKKASTDTKESAVAASNSDSPHKYRSKSCDDFMRMMEAHVKIATQSQQCEVGLCN